MGGRSSAMLLFHHEPVEPFGNNSQNHCLHADLSGKHPLFQSSPLFVFSIGRSRFLFMSQGRQSAPQSAEDTLD